jgi:hypothetical protein
MMEPTQKQIRRWEREHAWRKRLDDIIERETLTPEEYDDKHRCPGCGYCPECIENDLASRDYWASKD